MKNLFTEHPSSIGETYFQHFCFAFKFGSQMMIGGFACIMHSIFPFMCKKTASNYLLSMTDDFICRMPVMEERVAKLARSIDEKMCQNTQHANS